MARLGLAARGVVYLLIGGLALQIALGRGGKESDQNGALRTVAGQPFGKVLLALMAPGFAGYALWRFTEVAYGETGGDGGAGGRVKSAFRGLAYAGVCYTTIALLTGVGSAAQSQTLTAKAMRHTGGRVAVGLVGLALIAVGIALVIEGVRKKFEKYLRMQEMTTSTRTVVERLGMVGTAARGFVFAVAGFLILLAAIIYDPHEARGLDGALKSLRTPHWGRGCSWWSRWDFSRSAATASLRPATGGRSPRRSRRSPRPATMVPAWARSRCGP